MPFTAMGTGRRIQIRGGGGGRGGSVFRVTSVEALRRPTDTGEFEVHRHALRL
jgi:hypothetical protein